MNETAITDGAIPYIASLSNLQGLQLRKTKITDAALPFLLKLSHLRELELPYTFGRNAGLTLKQALPNCKIRREHS